MVSRFSDIKAKKTKRQISSSKRYGKLPVKFTTDDYNITREEAAIFQEIREEYNVKNFKTVKTAAELIEIPSLIAIPTGLYTKDEN